MDALIGHQLSSGLLDSVLVPAYHHDVSDLHASVSWANNSDRVQWLHPFHMPMIA